LFDCLVSFVRYNVYDDLKDEVTNNDYKNRYTEDVG